jgi:hypothetical protein
MNGKRLGLVIGNNYPNSDKELKFEVADAIAWEKASRQRTAFTTSISPIHKSS